MRKLIILIKLFCCLTFLAQTTNVSSIKEYKNTIFTNTFFFPEIQSTICYGRTFWGKSTVYIGFTYLHDVLVINKNSYYAGYNTSYLRNGGFIAGYHHLLSKPHRRVKFYLDGNTNFYGYKGAYKNTLIARYIYHDLAFNLNIAMKVRFLKYFYYYQSVGSGVNILFRNDLSNKQHSSYFEAHEQIINAGLGCNF